ncbi:hypothetical protein BH23CHL2_BH23CHL2_21120 [soil metagenome]
MAHINARPARVSTGLLLLLVASLLAACASSSGAAVNRPTATPAALPAGPAPTHLPFAAALTAEARDTPYVIERVTLTTNVDADGVPIDEVTVIPSNSRRMFLSVLVTGLQPPVRFRAFWYEGDRIIGQSEVMVEESSRPAGWVSLGFQTTSDLNPALPHSVELRINNRLVDSYTFRVGTGALEDVVADAVVSLGTRDGEPVEPGQIFDIFAPQIVAVVRVSQNVDPTGMIFSAFLFRGDTLIEQRSPDGGPLELPADPQPTDRQMTFTFVPDTSFTPGDYHITLLLNGAEILTLPFTIIPNQRPTATPIPPTAGPTATGVSSGISVLDVQLTEQLDDDSGTPEGDSIESWVGEPNQQRRFWLSLHLADTRIDDVVEVDALLWDRHINRHRYPAAEFDQGWLSMPINLWAPAAGEGPKTYRFLVFVNGVQLRTYTVTVDNNLPDPTPTADAAATATPDE